MTTVKDVRMYRSTTFCFMAITIN